MAAQFAAYRVDTPWRVFSNNYGVVDAEQDKIIDVIYIPFNESGMEFFGDVQRSGEAFFSITVFEDGASSAGT